MPARLSTEEQWRKLSKIVQNGIERSSRIQQLNAAASVQLDAAEHALDRLFEEVAAFIPQARPWPRSAVVAVSRQGAGPYRIAA